MRFPCPVLSRPWPVYVRFAPSIYTTAPSGDDEQKKQETRRPGGNNGQGYTADNREEK